MLIEVIRIYTPLNDIGNGPTVVNLHIQRVDNSLHLYVYDCPNRYVSSVFLLSLEGGCLFIIRPRGIITSSVVHGRGRLSLCTKKMKKVVVFSCLL